MSDFTGFVFPHRAPVLCSISAGLTVVEADDEHLEFVLSCSVLGLCADSLVDGYQSCSGRV